MRILQICGTHIGGGWFIDQVTELARRGHDVTAVVPGRGPVTEALDEAGVPYEILPFRGYRPRNLPNVARAVGRIAHLARSGEFDLVHAHLLKSIVIARLSCIGVRSVGLVSQVAGTVHLESRPLAGFDRSTLFLDTMLIASCEAFGERYRTLGAKNVRVNHYGCDTERFSPDADGSVFRAEQHLGRGQVAVGLIAHLYPTRLRAFQDIGVKGHEVYIDAAEAALERNPNLVFFVVGDEFIGDGKYRAELEMRAQRRGLGDSMRFIGHRNDIESVIAGLDILTNPSLSESASYTMIEASLMRKPVIGTAVGGLLDTILPGKTGLLVPPADSVALAEAFLTLAADTGLRAQLGRAGRDHVRAMFDIVHTVDVLEGLYREAIVLRRSGRYRRAGGQSS